MHNEKNQNFGEKAAGMVDAMKLTPMIKSALINDSMINDPANNINVDTTNDEVCLKGHVKSNTVKADAEHIARRILTENNANHRLVNELVVDERVI